jgi:hypothetical protein
MALRSRRSWSICELPQSPVPVFFRLCCFTGGVGWRLGVSQSISQPAGQSASQAVLPFVATATASSTDGTDARTRRSPGGARRSPSCAGWPRTSSGTPWCSRRGSPGTAAGARCSTCAPPAPGAGPWRRCTPTAGSLGRGGARDESKVVHALPMYPPHRGRGGAGGGARTHHTHRGKQALNLGRQVLLLRGLHQRVLCGGDGGGGGESGGRLCQR